MALTCDFVPDECSALSIQLCILTKICEIELLDWDSVNESLQALLPDLPVGGTGGLFLSASAEITNLDACIVSIVTAAAAAAGCPFPPPLPPLPPAPDFTECFDAIERIQSDVTDPLAFLAPFMTVTFSSDFRPLRITVP